MRGAAANIAALAIPAIPAAAAAFAAPAQPFATAALAAAALAAAADVAALAALVVPAAALAAAAQPVPAAALAAAAQLFAAAALAAAAQPFAAAVQLFAAAALAAATQPVATVAQPVDAVVPGPGGVQGRVLEFLRRMHSKQGKEVREKDETVQQHMQRIPQVRHLVRRQHTPRLWLILVHSEHGRKICDRVGQGELLQYASLQEQVHADLWRMRVLVRRARDEHETSTRRARFELGVLVRTSAIPLPTYEKQGWWAAEDEALPWCTCSHLCLKARSPRSSGVGLYIL